MQLHDYQERAACFAQDTPKCAIWADMGLGKTLTTIVTLDRHHASLSVNKTLIIAPKRVAMQGWPDELVKWSGAHNLTWCVIAGSPAKRTQCLNNSTDVHIIGVDNLKWLVEHLGSKWPYDCVVIDESSMFKNHQTKTRFKALRKVYKFIDHMIQLTGTPAPNSLLDIWPQIYLLDKGERLGKTITAYRKQYFHTVNMGNFNTYKIREGAEQEIYDAISDIVFRLSAQDYSNIPDYMSRVVNVQLTPQLRSHYLELEREFLIEVDDEKIEASNAAVLTGKLLQYCNGGMYTEDKSFKHIHDMKIEALERLAESGENLLVAYNFKSDFERIKKAFPDAVDIKEKDAMKRWNAGEIRMLLAHPASAGHGLNLQQGGHVIVWFGLTWSLELYQQFNARLHRQGQQRPVVIYHIAVTDSVDMNVLDSLEGKNLSQAELLQAMRQKAIQRLQES